MDEQREPERIEIELTSHEPTGGQRRPAPADDGDGDAVVTATVGESSVGVLGTERGRLIAATALVGVIALLVGVLVGRTGSDDATADEAATETTVRERTTTTVSSNTETLPTVRTVVTPPPTTRPEVTPAPVDETDPTEEPEEVEPDPPVNGFVQVAPEFAELGVEIVGLTRRNEVIRVDPATGTTVTYPPVSEFGSAGVYAGPGWILVPTMSVVDTAGKSGMVVLADDGTTSIIETEGQWPVAFADDGSGRFWMLGEADGGLRAVEMSVSGGPTGSHIDFTSYPRLVDPLGGFVVDATGGSYRVTPDGTTRLSPGHVVAAGRNTLFVEECDEFLTCEHLVVDRETGARRSVDVVPELRNALRLDVMGQWLVGDVFNEADGTLLLAFWHPTTQEEQVGILDLETGDFTGWTDVASYQADTMRWTPDGRSIVWLDETGRLAVIDVETGESRRFSEDLDPLTAFALRPLNSAVEG